MGDKEAKDVKKNKTKQNSLSVFEENPSETLPVWFITIIIIIYFLMPNPNPNPKFLWSKS